jgi:hypothetical protein
MLPPLDNKVVLDIGSRLGAALYGVRVVLFDNGMNYIHIKLFSVYLFGLATEKLVDFVYCIIRKNKQFVRNHIKILPPPPLLSP